MTKLQKPKRKKRIQFNILLRMALSLIIATALNNGFILLFSKIGDLTKWEEFIKFFPYLLTPLFIIIFIITFLILTRKIVRDLITLEQGLEVIAEGNLSHRVPENRQDELGSVAMNINKMTERLHEQMEKEREIEQSKMDLITGLSHDLRTPLTSIIGYIQLLKSESFHDKDEYSRFVQNTYNKAIHLRKLIDDLFEYTRLTSVDETQLNRREINLLQLLEQLLFEFEPLAQENGIHIVKEMETSQINAFIDSDKIARAIDNLLMNALKYSLKPGTIYVRLKKHGSDITIEVQNKGTQLTANQADKLFDRFYKVDFSRSSEGIQAGAGLGLSIARNIAELHQGSLALHHTDDVFLFKMTLPLYLLDE